MSELYHNGMIKFDRMLSDDQAGKIRQFFPDWEGNVYFSTDRNGCVSVIELEDYVTGRSGLDGELNDLADYCKEHGIRIDKESLIEYCGDDDGGWCFDDGQPAWLSRDDIGVRTALTATLVSELERRGELNIVVHCVPTDALRAELEARQDFMGGAG